MEERRLIPVADARQRLGVSKATMARLLKEGRLAVHENPLDRRVKLLDEAEVERLARFRRGAEPEGKAAA